jgi:4-amino-4-deoxy-L-arabinose transferase-like glycosyltransferase
MAASTTVRRMALSDRLPQPEPSTPGAGARLGAAWATGVLAAAFLATRLALVWRFPWFVDETTFASFARDVHADIGQFFIAETDKKGLLPSWLGAGLIDAGVAPVTAMRLLAAAGAALAAICGGLVVRRLYGLREALLTAALIALGPFFLVTASVGVYDAMVTGLVTAAALIAIRMAQRPTLPAALALGCVLGAGGLTKPTAWAALVIVVCTPLLFEGDPPYRRRRLHRWAWMVGLAVVVAFALTSVARLTPLHDQPAFWEGRDYHSFGPIAVQGHGGFRGLFADFGTKLSYNAKDVVVGLFGYLTFPGVVLAVIGVRAGRRRHPAAATILGAWALSVIITAILLPLWGNPRYFAAAMVPLAAFVALGACAVWDFILARFRNGGRARLVACAVALAAVLPAAAFDVRVLSDPARAGYPGLDEQQYVTRPSALAPLAEVAHEIERRGGPYPVAIDVGPYPARIDVGSWGLDLLLNGDRTGPGTRFRIFAHGTPAERATARYVISDGEPSNVSPRPGFRLIRRIARPDGGAVMRLYARS